MLRRWQVLILAFAASVRFVNLGRPDELVFDEIYYVDGAKDFLKYAVEVENGKSEFIVHPPIGKWVIALGIKLFGDNSFGWRFSTALLGTISILFVYLIAKHLFKSEKWALLSAALVSLDGLHLVMSRTALLDMTLMFFVLIGLYALLKERFWAAGFLLGLALATKWSAIYYIVFFGIYYLARDFYKIRKSGDFKIQNYFRAATIRTVQLAILPIFTYVATWLGWFNSTLGWSRNWGVENPGLLPNALRSFWHYQSEILYFHTHLTENHSYEAKAWSWLLMYRPTSFFYETPKGCGAASCAQEVLAMGTPVLWWIATISLVILVALWLKNKQWSTGFILLAVSAGYLPWFVFSQRTTFTFYAIVFEPWLMMALVAVLRIYYLNSFGNSKLKFYLIVFLLCIFAANFIYHFPIFVGQNLTYDDWRSLMWFKKWI
ncbi:putative dolichyl-phosphate-mannose--protein mannosyltransferase [Actinomycetes bacterium]|nr:putative dolichyl-phosphate-mannose--protein mannosyltransferase [Actinomycetes bacterium]